MCPKRGTEVNSVPAHPDDDLLEDLTDEDARRALDLGLYLLKCTRVSLPRIAYRGTLPQRGWRIGRVF